MATSRRGRSGRFKRAAARGGAIARRAGGAVRRAGGAVRRNARRALGPSDRERRQRQAWEGLVYSSVASLAFGYIQSKTLLPGIKGVPNSLTYGVGGVAAGVLLGSDAVVAAAQGPLCAGLHNLALKGFTNADQLAGEFDQTAGEYDAVEGEFDQTAGEFDAVEGEFDQLEGDTSSAPRGQWEDAVAGDFDNL